MQALRLLIVEDERIIAFDLRQRLQKLGYDVCALAARGDEAIRLSEELRPDMILMDIRLEGEMDGIQAAKAICARRPVPVVFLTAYAEDEILRRAQESLPYGFLVKPCESRELHATLQMAFARHSSEVQVKLSEQRLQLALDAARLGVWEWDSATGRLETVGRVGEIVGGRPEPVGESWEEFVLRVHPDDRGTMQGVMNCARASGNALDAVFRAIDAGGSVRWVEAHVKAFEYGEGKHRLIGVVHDVTERLQTQEQLRQAGVVFATTAEGIFITNAEFVIVSVNPALTHITGYSEAEALGRDAGTFLHSRRFHEHLASLVEASGNGRWEGETYWQRKSGEVFPAWESLCAVRDGTGAVTHYVGAVADISAIRRAEEELNHLAHHDSLTGLPNRLLFSDRLQQALDRAQREQQRCALLFMDLDGFKVINDTLGHDAGDRLLQALAERLRQNLRRADTAARLGGDEFVVLMEDIAQPEDGGRLAAKLIDILARPVDVGGKHIHVSASIGVSVFPEDGTDGHSLLKAADTAMYGAKTQGRNRYCFYTLDMTIRSAERMDIEQGLRQALDNGGMDLHFQPQISLNDGALVGFEALLRWRRAGEGVVAPERFVGVAEESGLITRLGEWVLRAACREAAQWQQPGGIPLSVSVNVSPRQLVPDHRRFADAVASALGETGLPPHLLELEITESTLQEVDSSRALLDEMHELGVTIAIDDFGTGYSSLSLLQRLPVDRLKIDRSFLRGIPDVGSDVAIVQAIIALARILGAKLVAEGVETAAHLAALREMGCEVGQGYLLGRPVPAAEVIPLTQAHRPWASAAGRMSAPIL